MRTRKLAVLISAGVLLLAGINGLGQKASPGKTPNYSENVTTTIFDTDSSGVQVLFRSDDYNGTGQATYATGGNGTSSVYSAIDSTGAYQLSFSSGSPRTLWVTPDEAINGSQPVGPPPNYYGHPAKVDIGCVDQSGNTVPLENVVNGSGNCTMGVDFVSNGIEYKLYMSPRAYPTLGANCAPSGCPATGVASVACNAVSNSQCVNWTITPNTLAANANVASLFSYTGTKTAPWVFIGQYFNTFRVTFTNP